MTNSYTPWGIWGSGAFTLIWVPILIVSIAAGSLGVFLMSSSRVRNVRLASFLVLVAAVLSVPKVFGFVVGSVLMGLGGIVGLARSRERFASL